ncbi:hypothetical protein DV704_05195 [Meiothermus sp. QL-1]|uniref:hypothetical protein n=1 Tax=Meiothermus sp. QL-1 TaxID=2058095 RepID=UPI000E0A684E|nr:hypothetical protein [Meiothermus sp. QL-1]RDI95675.1 hypothetical protein DV704_05195 [Meiothermus sp. QL-1]
MLPLGPVLAQSLRLLLQRPLGVLALLGQALLVSLASLGLLTGPMQVGIYRVLLGYIREGVWRPEALWGGFSPQALVGGVVFAASSLAAFAVGGPLLEPHPLPGLLGQGVLQLLWFYTFQLMADRALPWPTALRQGWRMLGQGGLGRHLLLAGALEALAFLSTLLPWPPLQLAAYLLLLGWATVVKAVAYAALGYSTA